MDALTGWLGGVPVGALYALIFSASFLEGLLPIVPGDVAAALLAFYAARAGGNLAPTIAAVTTGSVLGALIMWWLGRHYGAEWLGHQMRRLHLVKSEAAVGAAGERVEAAYRQYGWVALFVSRFLPGVRSVVPAIAGALKIPLWEVAAIFTIASSLWYGGISYIAFHVGRDWSTVRETTMRVLRDVGIGAVAVALVLVAIGWRLWKRRRAAVREANARANARSNERTGTDAP